MVASARELVASGPRIASPPLVYERLVTAIQDPRSRASDIGKVLGEDPGLSTRVLKVVNSALYAFPKRIETISQAVTVVGTGQIKDLALATSVISIFKDVPKDLVNMVGFWSHSLACAVGARVLAGHLREHNVERFFVAGLIHDIGRLVMYMAHGEGSRRALELARETGVSLHEAEREVFGFDHAQVGAVLLESWNLPGCFKEAVACHHAPLRAKQYPREAAAVHIADIVANALELGHGGQSLVPTLTKEVWDATGISSAAIPVFFKEVEDQHGASVQTIMGLVS